MSLGRHDPLSMKTVSAPFLTGLAEIKKTRGASVENDYTEQPITADSFRRHCSGSDVTKAILNPEQRFYEKFRDPPPIPPRPRELFDSNFAPKLATQQPPPRPPKSAELLLRMSKHQVFRPPHPSLRDRRGDVIEPLERVRTSQPRHKRQTRSCVKQKPRHIVLTQPRQHDDVKSARDEPDEDDVTKAKMRLKDESKEKMLKCEERSERCCECPHCGKCICGKCGRSSRRHSKMKCCATCSERVDCDVSTCLEFATCMSCVRCSFYHFTERGNSESDEVSWADEPCACHGNHCCLRWTYLGLMSICLPCILLYPCVKFANSICHSICYSSSLRPDENKS